VCTRVAIVYNDPIPSRYDTFGEEKAVLGVLEAEEAVHQALSELGYTTVRVPLAPPAERIREKLTDLEADLVFNLFEGFCGRPETEALVPEVLSELGTPYTGCSGTLLRLALDKARVKTLLKAAGIRTPDFQLLTPGALDEFRLNYPCIVKPNSEDASHGLSEQSLVSDPASLAKQVRLVSDGYGGDALVEEFAPGREFNATVLGSARLAVLPISEIVYSLPPEMPRVLTFAAKWENDSPYYQATRAVCPAKIGAKEKEDISQMALAVARWLELKGYGRVDMRVDKEGKLNVIEVNPNPDISPGTGAARQAEAAGMSYAQFIDRIVKLALESN
jgi:D-alanine-D-alanine ligase